MDKNFKRELYERIKSASNPLLARDPSRGYSLKKTMKKVFESCMRYSIQHRKHLSPEELLRHSEECSRLSVKHCLEVHEFKEENRKKVLDYIRKKLRDLDTPEYVIDSVEEEIKDAIFQIFGKLAKRKHRSKFDLILEEVLRNSELAKDEIVDSWDCDLFPF